MLTLLIPFCTFVVVNFDTADCIIYFTIIDYIVHLDIIDCLVHFHISICEINIPIYEIYSYMCISIFSSMFMFCRSLFVLSSFFFDLRIMITPLVISDFSYDFGLRMAKSESDIFKLFFYLTLFELFKILALLKIALFSWLCEGVILMCWKRLHDHIISLTGKVYDHKFSAIPPFRRRACTKPGKWKIVYIWVRLFCFATFYDLELSQYCSIVFSCFIYSWHFLLKYCLTWISRSFDCCRGC